jgi:hypothetical protein
MSISSNCVSRCDRNTINFSSYGFLYSPFPSLPNFLLLSQSIRKVPISSPYSRWFPITLFQTHHPILLQSIRFMMFSKKIIDYHYFMYCHLYVNSFEIHLCTFYLPLSISWSGKYAQTDNILCHILKPATCLCTLPWACEFPSRIAVRWNTQRL